MAASTATETKISYTVIDVTLVMRARANTLPVANSTERPEQVTYPEATSASEFYASCVGFLRRQFLVILLAVAAASMLGILYIWTTPARYIGRAMLIVDAPQTQFFQSQSAVGSSPIDSATVDTQIQILKSEDLALSVIKDLHLNEDPELVSPVVGVIGRALQFATVKRILQAIAPGMLRSPDQASNDDRALRTFLDRLKVSRVGLTYVIQIEFESADPYRAAQIANALADAYELATFEAKYQITGRAAQWLQDRLKNLRDQASAAERAVVNYKAAHNIVDTGGRLMDQQQLAELNSELYKRAAQRRRQGRGSSVSNRSLRRETSIPMPPKLPQ